MREFLKRRGAALVLFGAALVVLLAGSGLSWGTAHDEQRAATPQMTLHRETRSDALAARVGVTVEALGVSTTQGAVVQPPVLRGAPVPTLDARREVTLPPASAVPVSVETDLALASGAAMHRASWSDAGAEIQDASAAQVPLTAPAVLAAAALTGAGLLAWGWTALKAGAKKLLVVPAIALYARISRADVFENEVRERLFTLIRERPGIAATDLARVVGVSWGTTIYHLDVLERNRMVTSLREGRRRRYFENGAGLQATKEIVALLQNPVTAGVVETLKRTPGATQKELAGATNMSPQALHWHLARLVGAGLVRKEREGRVVRHYGGT